MNTDDKKPSNVQMTLENLSDAATNIREVDFKKHPNDIVQTIGEETEAILITYEKDKGELKLYHNGNEIDKAVFAKKLKAETGFYAMFDYLQEKFKSWTNAWM
jgi:predicted FMN-binding regulatory protein PaiB|tara:strand:- start:3507 stop:3815 length:309 start_codon:yes stop_codon:yes gene_type:complete